ncbi:hypothetical protein HOC80_04010 [archaeon]|jgi:hypothetical protein|nr:hypothetical protein [archaeon]MBT4417238.1 hypothetical protein [archaeon]
MVYTVEMLKKMTKPVKMDNLHAQLTELSSFHRDIGGTEREDLVREFINGYLGHLMDHMKDVNGSIVNAENALNDGKVDEAKRIIDTLRKKHFSGF